MIIFNFRIFENVQQAKSLLAKYDKKQDNEIYLFLKKLTQKNPGYLGFFVKMWLENDVDKNSLKELYDILDKPYINKLSKNIIEYTEWEELQDDLIKARNEYKIKKIKDEIPSEQKRFVDYRIEELFIKLYDREDKNNFLKKIARYKTYKSLYDALYNFVNSVQSRGFQNTLKDIKDNNISIKHMDPSNDIIIVEVKNHNQLRSIASDSSWCILDSSTFRNYTSGFNRQFVIFLTDLKDNYSKIGVTYGFKYRTAHLLNDEYISKYDLKGILNERNFDLSDLFFYVY
jgi:transcriptional regulator of NAD metabolism